MHLTMIFIPWCQVNISMLYCQSHVVKFIKSIAQ